VRLGGTLLPTAAGRWWTVADRIGDTRRWVRPEQVAKWLRALAKDYVGARRQKQWMRATVQFWFATEAEIAKAKSRMKRGAK
jgi:hypothetical protein